MYINGIYSFNTNFTPTAKDRAAVVAKRYQRQPAFCGGLSAECLKTINETTAVFKKSFSPARKNYLAAKKDVIIPFYNKFYNSECENLAVRFDAKPEMILENVFGDSAGAGLKISEGPLNKSLQLTISRGGNDSSAYVLANNGNILNPGELHKPLESRESRAEVEEFMPIAANAAKKFGDFLNMMISDDITGYAGSLCGSIRKKIGELDGILQNVEIGKRGLLKRSYPNYVQFQNKNVYFFRDFGSINADKYAFIPHRRGDENLYRLLQYDSRGEITDAYLIDMSRGVIKNYCPQKKFNLANVNHTPKDLSVMSAEEMKNSNVTSCLEKYFGLLDDFANHINSKASHSAKMLAESAYLTSYISFNKVKQEFTSRLPKLFETAGENEIAFVGKDGCKYSLKQEQQDGLNLWNLVYDKGNGERVIKIDADNSKILQTTISGRLVRTPDGAPAYYSHSSDSFITRSKILKSFITDAYEEIKPASDEGVKTALSDLGTTFADVRNFWESVSKTKKTAVQKAYPGLVEARGDVGGLRFRITGKDYQLGLKPQRLNSSEFMRLTVYDNDGNIKNAFLLKDFDRIIDNYCSAGNFTKDAIARIPKNLVYKTDEQITKAKLPQYIGEFLTELKKFGNFARETTVDKRLAEYRT